MYLGHNMHPYMTYLPHFWTRPLTTGRLLKDHGWSVNFNQKVVPDQDVIRERILDNLSFKAAPLPPKKRKRKKKPVSKSSYGIISSIIPCQDPRSKLHTSEVSENFLDNFIM